MLSEFVNIVKTKRTTTEILKNLLNNQKVEWKKLGEVCEVLRGSRLTKKELSDEYEYPVFHGGLEPLGFYKESNRQANTVMIINVGASAGTVGYSPIEFWSSDGCYCIEHKSIINSRFLYYFLIEKQHLLISKVRKAGIPTLDAFIVEQIPIPIPPLSIQAEIVDILDTLTTHTTQLKAELKAELKARKTQYTFYRNKLLTFKDGDVQWKKLGEVTQYEQPTKYLVKSQNYSDSFSIPVLTAGKTFILGYTDEVDGICKGSKKPVIIFDDFTTANKWVDFDFKAKSSAMKIITSSDDAKFILKYIYYWLNTLSNELEDTDHKRQWISNFCNKAIPIPPLSVQREIVDILDTLTTHTTQLKAELKAELKARKTQYTFYRNKLLTFKDGDVQWKKLGEVDYFEIANSERKPVKADLRVTGNIPYYGANNIQDYVEGHTHDGEFILIAEDGSADLKNYSIQYVNGKFWANNHVHVVCGKAGVNTRFLYHYLKTFNFMPFLSSTERAKLTKGKMVEITIPISPLSVQREIVEVLDKFDYLTNSISKGLPKEIELRQQQYEYYRNQLLNFKK